MTKSHLDPYFRAVFDDIAAKREAANSGGRTGFAKEVKSTGDYPMEWHAISCELVETDQPLECFGDRWTTMAHDAKSFLERWGKTVHLLGWTALDLFGVHPNAPAARFDVMGLVPMLNGRPVIAITKEGASIKAQSAAILTYSRITQAGAMTVTKCAHMAARARNS
jgi:hypothetical protein